MNNRYIRVEGHEGFYRDSQSNAIVNRNGAEYSKFKNEAKKKNEINIMKEELAELKSLIKDLKKD
tara:strand:- start:10046 stop:10240 length:195 start_codon:yes stop_codon:yes gene_type:complete